MLQQVNSERQMRLFPLFSSIPLHLPGIQILPISSFFCVFCHTFASSLNPHLNSTVPRPGFPCPSFQCFFHLVFDSLFVRLETVQSPLEPVKLHGQCFRWQQTNFLYQQYWVAHNHDFLRCCVLCICVNVSRSCPMMPAVFPGKLEVAK